MGGGSGRWVAYSGGLGLGLAAGAGEEEGLAVGGEAGLGDAFFGVEGVDQGAVGGGEEGGVPGALGLASSHDEVGAAGVPGEGFHEAGAVLAVADLVEALALEPIPALPSHFAVAGHGVAHGAHAAA